MTSARTGWRSPRNCSCTTVVRSPTLQPTCARCSPSSVSSRSRRPGCCCARPMPGSIRNRSGVRRRTCRVVAMAEHARRSGRRTPAPPAALAGELVRARLLERVGRRFEVPITVVVGGAGFGKSTLLAQAIRANQADPRGVDVWLSCEPGDGDAACFADALVEAIGHGSARGEPVERVLDALVQAAPIDVCVVIDEIQEISRRSSAAALLGELAARLPAHAHLVLAGRNAPPVALAQRSEEHTSELQ